MRTFGQVTLNKETRNWVIDCEAQVMVRLKRVFERIAKTAKGHAVLADTPENGRELAWFLERYPMTMDDGDARALLARDKQHRALGEQIARILAGGYTPREFDLAMPPREYQRVAADLALQTGQLLVGDDLGLGKTATAICVLSDPRARPALVVTLTHLPRQWRAELQKFLPGAAVHIVKGTTPYDLNPIPDVIVMNYHKLDGWAHALNGKVKSVVFDEVQELRRTGTTQKPSLKYEGARLVASGADIRVGLSATPIFNFGGELFNVMDVLAPGALGEWPEFAREWTTDGSDRTKAVVKEPRALGSYLREQGLMLRRTRREVGRELPGLSIVPHTIDANLDEIDKVASSAMELARVILRQGQHAKMEKLKAAEELSWRLRQATGIAKAHFVAEFVRMLVESGEQVLLFGWHREVFRIWMERLADFNPVMFTGSESVNQKDAAKQAFVDGAAKVLIMSNRAGAGIDGLQGVCRTVVIGELDWSPKVHEQGIGRVYRDGQIEPCVAYYLIADCGSDPVIVDVLGLKRTQADGIMDPTAALIEESQVDPERIKTLATEFLRQRGEKVPTATRASKVVPLKQLPLTEVA